MTDVVRPPALRPGDRVAIVSPSSPVVHRDRLERGLAQLRSWGLDPVVFPHADDVHGHLAGTDDDRAADLNAAFRDPGIRAVIASRGGYGVTRILHRLDWAALRHDPKLVVGFSDVTALLLAAWQRLRLVTVHGPFAGRLHLLGGDEESAHLRRLLTDPRPAGMLTRAGDAPVETVVGGVAEGRLLGGNLSVLCALVGTVDAPDTDGAILVIEDVNEAPYRLDRSLTQLHRAGVLDHVTGVIVGEMVGCDPPTDRPSLPTAAVVRAAFAGLGIPVVHGLPIGHVDRQLALPLGVRSRLDADAGTLTLLEPATTPRQPAPAGASA
ncbi:MAG: LD-carboxypeptidase [Actinomycetota bacterium]|nr:LD-carboxypeptidase [Actinomycetota bacterium]